MRQPQIATALILGAAALFLYAAASAQNPAPALTMIGDEHTQLVVDTEAHTVRILIDGQEQAIIDREGLQVRGDIRSSGSSGLIYTNRYEKKPDAP